jgi:RNA polymerase sigma-70 factor (ECF subfamily)
VTDDELVLATPSDPEAFGMLYARHERAICGYFLRRTRDAELAADLTAETFAAALLAAPRFRARPDAPAVAWLFGIARNVLRRSLERSRVEDRARRRLGMPPLELSEEQLAALDRVHADDMVARLLATLPPEQAAAVRAHVVDDEPYAVTAARLEVSEAVVRQRVSRGLRRLRTEASR